MDYAKAFTFFAKKQPKSGWNNLLFGAVCMAIPIVGPFVFFGYRLEVGRDLEDDPEMLCHRDFDFNRFGEYLSKGIWMLPVALVGAGAAVTAALGIGALVYSLNPGLNPFNRLLAGTGGGYLGYFLCVILVLPLFWAIECHYAMSGRFRIVEAIAFAAKFYRLMFGQIAVTLFVFIFAATVLGLVGTLACCIGQYVALPIVSMASGHIVIQLYRKYLEKGGEPIRRYAENEDDDEGH